MDSETVHIVPATLSDAELVWLAEDSSENGERKRKLGEQIDQLTKGIEAFVDFQCPLG
jgi:hypothetical protein